MCSARSRDLRTLSRTTAANLDSKFGKPPYPRSTWSLPWVHFPVVSLAFLAAVECLLAPWALLEFVLRVQLDAEGLPCRCVHRFVPPADETTVVGMVGYRQGHDYGDNWQVLYWCTTDNLTQTTDSGSQGEAKFWIPITLVTGLFTHGHKSILLFDDDIGKH